MECTHRLFILYLTIFVNLISIGGVAQSFPGPPSDALAKIAKYGVGGSAAYQYVEELTDEIGPRLTGTPQAARAGEWAVEKMKAIGLHSVHLEHWQLPTGWERGYARAQLTAPVVRALTVTSFGWTGCTPVGGIEAEVVAFQRGPSVSQVQKLSPGWAGKILFLVPDASRHVDSVKDFAELDHLVTAAADAGALAVVAGEDHPETAGIELSHTGPVSFTGTLYSIPVVDMTVEDSLQLQRFLTRGKQVHIKLDVQNRIIPRPVDSVNVVGEISGDEHPDRILVVAAHLDSWDLSPGAVDDGVGVAAVLAAAKAIISAGVKPRQTIRFILFTGEEQGLLGSRAYVRDHQAEMANHLGAVAIDLGQGPITELHLAGHDALIASLQSFVNEIKSFATIKVDDSFILFTDAYSFTLAGLPGISFGQNSPGYAILHHSNADTLDKVDVEALRHNTAIVALTCFWIADQPARLEPIWSKEETAEMLSKRKYRELLEMLKMWPF